MVLSVTIGKTGPVCVILGRKPKVPPAPDAGIRRGKRLQLDHCLSIGWRYYPAWLHAKYSGGYRP